MNSKWQELVFCAAAIFPGAGLAAGLGILVNTSDVAQSARAGLEETVQFLRESIPGTEFRIDYASEQAVSEAILRGDAEIVISSGGFYRRFSGAGLRDLAGTAAGAEPDPNRAAGVVFVVRSVDTALDSIHSLLGKRVVLSSHWGWQGAGAALEVLREALPDEKRQEPPALVAETLEDTFGIRVRSLPNLGVKPMLEMLYEGRADAVALPACLLENIAAGTVSGLENVDTGWVRPLSPGGSTSLPCAVSAPPQPGIVVAVSPKVTPGLSREIESALLSVSNRWGTVTDWRSVDRSIDELGLSYTRPPPESNRVGDFLIRYRWWFAAACLAFLLLALHSILVTRTVRHRTASLVAALDREKALRRELSEGSRRLERMEKLGTLGQMASLFAHELGQPLSAIRFSAFGLSKILSKGALAGKKDVSDAVVCLSEIEKAVEKAGAIVQRVRCYLKSRRGTGSLIDLGKAAQRAVAMLEKTSASARPHKVVLRISEDHPVIARIEEMEVELVVANLLRNAYEAQPDLKKTVEAEVSVER